MLTLAELRLVLERVAEVPAADRADAIGLCAAAQARLLAPLVTPTSVALPIGLVDAVKMARLLDVPANWVRDKARAGALPSRQLGHYVRFDPAEVLEAARQVPGLHDSQLRRRRKRQEPRGGCPKGVHPSGDTGAA